MYSPLPSFEPAIPQLAAPSDAAPTAATPAGTLRATPFDAIFEATDRKYGLPQGLTKAVAARETGGSFRTDLVGKAGEQGMMQFMPNTAKSFGLTNPRDPVTSIDTAGRYLRKNYDMFQDWGHAVAGYNWGEGNVQKMLAGDARAVPPDITRSYVREVIGRLNSAGGGGGALPAATQARGADIGINGNQIYVNGVLIDAVNDRGKAIQAYRQGVFTTSGIGKLPDGFRAPKPGEIEGYFQNIIPSSSPGKSLRSGLENYFGGYQELSGMVQQAFGVEPSANTGITSADRHKLYASELAGMNTFPQTFEKAEGVTGVAQYAFGKALESAPFMVELIGPAAVGAVIKSIGMRGVRMAGAKMFAETRADLIAKGASEEMATAAATRAAAEVPKLGLFMQQAPALSVWAGGIPSAAGDIAGNQREEMPGSPYNIPAVAGLALPYSALNLLGVGGMASRVGGRVVTGATDAMRGVPGVAGRAVRGLGGAVRTGLEEGIGEVGQEVLNQAGRMSVNPAATIDSPEAMARYYESFAGGAAVGGLTGGAGGVLTRSNAPVNVLQPIVPVTTAAPDNFIRAPQTLPKPGSELLVGATNPDLTSSLDGASAPGSYQPTGDVTPGAQPQFLNPQWKLTDSATGQVVDSQTHRVVRSNRPGAVTPAETLPRTGVTPTEAVVANDTDATMSPSSGTGVETKRVTNVDKQVAALTRKPKVAPAKSVDLNPDTDPIPAEPADIPALQTVPVVHDGKITAKDEAEVAKQLSLAAKRGKPITTAEKVSRETPKNVEQVHSDVMDNLPLNDSLRSLEGAQRDLSSPYKFSKNKDDKLPPLYRKYRAKPQIKGRDRIAEVAGKQVEHLLAITAELDKLVAKHGVAGVNGLFAWRKAKNLEQKPKIKASKEEMQAQVAANIRLSNIWRLYRDGGFGAFGFSRGSDKAVGRTKYEHGANATTMQAWFDGGKVRLDGKPIKGIIALAYYMNHYGRSSLEHLLGSRIYQLLNKPGVDIGFELRGDKSISWKGMKGAVGAFLQPGVTVTTDEGEIFKTTKPTIVLTKAGSREDTFIHEMVHAATVHAVLKDLPRWSKSFRPIINAALSKKAPEELNHIISAISSKDDRIAISELLAYGFADTRFQDFLKTIDMPKGRMGVLRSINNAFEYFVNLIKIAIGAHGASPTALSRLIEEGARVFDTAEDVGVQGKGGIALAAQTTPNALNTQSVFSLLNPVTAIEKVYRAAIELALPFYREGTEGKTKFENYYDEKAAAWTKRIIYNAPPVVSRTIAGFVDKFGVPEKILPVVDMGRRITHNAGQDAFTFWSNIKGFDEAQQKTLHEYFESGGKLSLDGLPEKTKNSVINMNTTLKDVVSRAADAGALPAALRSANITELINWIEKDTQRIAFGLKATDSFKYKNWGNEYKDNPNQKLVIGDGPTYRRGEVTYTDPDGKTAVRSVYVSEGTTAAQAENHFGQDINLDTKRVWRRFKEQEGKTNAKMWSAISYADGRAKMKAANYAEALTLTLHNLLHNTAVHEFASIYAEKNTADDPIVFDSKEALEEHLTQTGQGAGRIVNLTKHPESIKLARTPGYWVKLGNGYGSLSGTYVPSTIYTMLADINTQTELFPHFRDVLNFWKKTKTAWSIPTHFNNIASSFVMMYMHDIRMSMLKRALDVYFEAKPWSKDAKQHPVLDRFDKSGALIASYNAGEFSETLASKLHAAVKQQHYVDNHQGLTQFLNTWEQVKTSVMHNPVTNKMRDAGEIGVKIYEFEDNLFRLAAFLEGEDRGMDQTQAGKFAADSMINYSIDARYINALRRTIMPFLSWPYRMVPMLIRTALFKPWKYAAMVSTIYALNAMAYAITGGDEDEERKKLPEYQAGRMWLLGGAPESVRMWTHDGKPVFWNVSNFLPLGNFTQESRNGLFGLPWPQGLMPGGPISVAANLALGFDSFTGKSLHKPTDSAGDKAANTIKQAWTEFSPNMPLPYNRQGDKLSDLLREKHGISGSEVEWGWPLLNMVGPKVFELDDKERSAQIGVQQRAILGEYRRAIRKLALDENRYANPNHDKVIEQQADLIARMMKEMKRAKGEER